MLAPLDLLGTHVCGRADDLSLRGQAGRITDSSGNAEVGDECVARIEQDVRRLDVAMHDFGVMRVAQRVRHLTRDLNRVADGKLALAHETESERFSLDVRHDVVHQTTGLVRVVQRQNVWVMQAGGDLDLVQESRCANFGGEVGTEHLDRDLSLVLQIVGEEHGRHSALSEFPLEPISVGDCNAEAIEQIRRSVLQPQIGHCCVYLRRLVPSTRHARLHQDASIRFGETREAPHACGLRRGSSAGCARHAPINRGSSPI